MEKLLRIHRNSEDIDFAKIWSEGIFVFDSNVLLDLYRLPKSACNDLIGVLQNEEFSKRIWIGFQVILEFLNNRLEAIGDQKNKFNTVRNLVSDSIQQYEGVFKSLTSELNKLKLKQRHSLIDPDKFITEDNIQKGIKFLNDFISDLNELETKQSDVTDNDEVKDLVLKTFESKVGFGFDKKTLQELYKEGEKRYTNNIPPGYKDIKKEGYYLYEDKEYIRKYGDLILWKEIIEKAKNEKIKYLVLITGDVKEDWWLEKRGKKLGPRLELLNEIYTEANDLDTFYMYDTSTFLKYSKNELKLQVKESSIKEAKDLIDISRLKRLELEEGYVNLPDIIRQTGKLFSTLRLGIGESVKGLSPIKINNNLFTSALMEIFSNVISHSSDCYVGIQANLKNGTLQVRFKNLRKKDEIGTEINTFRGKGLEYIKSALAKENIDISILEDSERFTLILYIPTENIVYI